MFTFRRRAQAAGAAAERRSTGTDASLSSYDSMIGEEARRAGVPEDLLRAICWVASGWRQFEQGGSVLATPLADGSTSYGCMQLNDKWHPDAFPMALNDAGTNVRFGATVLKWYHEQAQSWERATIALFGHDRRAERAARRVQRYRYERPWEERLPARTSDDAGATSSVAADGQR